MNKLYNYERLLLVLWRNRDSKLSLGPLLAFFFFGAGSISLVCSSFASTAAASGVPTMVGRSSAAKNIHELSIEEIKQ